MGKEHKILVSHEDAPEMQSMLRRLHIRHGSWGIVAQVLQTDVRTVYRIRHKLCRRFSIDIYDRAAMETDYTPWLGETSDNNPPWLYGNRRHNENRRTKD